MRGFVAGVVTLLALNVIRALVKDVMLALVIAAALGYISCVAVEWNALKG